MNVFSWGNNKYNQLGFPGKRGENVQSPRMISFFSEKGLKVEEVVASEHNSYFLCEGGELFGAGFAKSGKHGNSKLKTNSDTPILISRDVEIVFTGTAANYAFFTKLDESVWSFGWNYNQQRGFVGNEANDWEMSLHKNLASNEIVKIACGFLNTLSLKEGGRIYGAGKSGLNCGLDGKSFMPIPGLGDDLVFIDIEMGEHIPWLSLRTCRSLDWEETAMDNLDLETQGKECVLRSWSFLWD